MYEIIKGLCKKEGINIKSLEEKLNLGNGAISKWQSSSPKAENLQKIADYFDVSVDYLLGRTDKSFSNFSSEEIILVPIIAKVAAGFDHNFTACDIEEYQEVPLSIINGYEKSNLFCFLVSGDSMFPKFLDGDRVLVHRQSSVDSGSVAIVCYDDFEEGTIKKVVYEPGCNYVDMIPYNPNYKPVRLQGADLESCRIIGKIIYLFRKID